MAMVLQTEANMKDIQTPLLHLGLPALHLALPALHLALPALHLALPALHLALLYYTVKPLVPTPETLSRHVLLYMKACSTLGLAQVSNQSIIQRMIDCLLTCEHTYTLRSHKLDVLQLMMSMHANLVLPDELCWQ